MIGSTGFRDNVNVLFSAPILPNNTASISYEAGWSRVETPAADVLDLNAIGKADYTSKEEDRSGCKVRLTEPALYFPTMQQISDFAKANNRTIVTQDDLPEVWVSDVSCDSANTDEAGKCNREDNNVRPLSLVMGRQLDAINPKARYAFDVEKNEFLIYTPHESQLQ